MDSKKITYLIIGFIGLVSIMGVIYFVSIFSGSSNKTDETRHLSAFTEDNKTYKTKLAAYEDLAKDSILKVREDNVRIDLGKIFGKQDSSKKKTELIPEQNVDNRIKLNQDNKPNIISRSFSRGKKQEQKILNTENKPQSTISQVSSLSNSGGQSMGNSEELRTIQKNPKHRENFNSFSQGKPAGETKDPKPILIQAVVHTQQEVYEGSIVKLRTISPTIIDGKTIPINTLIYGAVSIANERVSISITSIPLGGSFIPLALKAFDKDGMQGVYIPGLAVQEMRKEAVGEVISSSQASLNVPVIGGVPLNTARIRNQKISAILTDGYAITLK